MRVSGCITHTYTHTHTHIDKAKHHRVNLDSDGVVRLEQVGEVLLSAPEKHVYKLPQETCVCVCVCVCVVGEILLSAPVEHVYMLPQEYQTFVCVYACMYACIQVSDNPKLIVYVCKLHTCINIQHISIIEPSRKDKKTTYKQITLL